MDSILLPRYQCTGQTHHWQMLPSPGGGKYDDNLKWKVGKKHQERWKPNRGQKRELNHWWADRQRFPRRFTPYNQPGLMDENCMLSKLCCVILMPYIE